MKFKLTETAVKNLMAYIGSDLDEPPFITLEVSDGKLFVYMTEYPEDGSTELEVE